MTLQTRMADAVFVKVATDEKWSEAIQLRRRFDGEKGVQRKYNPNHSPVNGRFTSRAGGSGVNVAGSDEEFAFLKNAEYKRVVDPTTGAEIDVDEGLVLLMENRGFYGKPTTLEKAEFNRAEKLSLDMEYGYDPRNSSPTNIYPTTDFYRGIQNVPGVPVEKMSDSLVDGSSRFHGVGTFGNGLYFSPDPRRARGYAGDQGMLQRMALKPDAKVITKHALVEEAFKLHGELGMGYNNVSELGRLATWLGYDVIHADDRIVVLNHSKLIIDKSSLVRLPREKSLDLFDIELKYNPNHDRLGRFSTGSGGGGITSDDLDYAAGIKMLADLKVQNGDFDGVGDFYLAEINAQKGFNGKPQVLEGAEFEKAVQESPVGVMRRGIRNTGNFSTIDVMEDELSGAAVYTGLGIHGNGLYFGVARKLGDADDKRSKTVAQVFADQVGARGGATYRATLAKDARVVTVEDVTKAYFNEFGKDDALSRGSARFNAMQVMQDPGRLAAIKGFDAMLIKKADATGVISTSQVVVFNRTKLIWDGESVRANSLEGGLKSWSLKFNPNHDRLGRFATTGGSGSFSDLEFIEGVVPLDSVGDWEDEVVTSDLTDAQDMSVRYYVGRGYSEINGNLRGGPKPFNEAEFWGNLQDAGGKELVRNVKNLDAATKKHKLKKDTTVFRGVTGDGWDLKRWEDRGFTSTSLSPTVAGSFGNVVMAISLPKGTKGYAHLGMNGEYEFLLPRNMKYRLVDKPVKVKLDGKDVTVLTATLA